MKAAAFIPILPILFAPAPATKWSDPESAMLLQSHPGFFDIAGRRGGAARIDGSAELRFLRLATSEKRGNDP